MLVKLATGDWVDATQVDAVEFGKRIEDYIVSVRLKSGSALSAVYEHVGTAADTVDDIAIAINVELERLNEGVCPECWSNERADCGASYERPPVAEAADFVVTDDGEADLGRGRE